ncbi:MAG: hypothetical protein QW051_01625 [Candidatus Aenigmatarchaeota archaeon]
MANRLEEVKNKTEEYVNKVFEEKRKKGEISLAHDIDHVSAVSMYGGLMSANFAKKVPNFNNDKIDYVKVLAEITGLVHDISREKTEMEPHGPTGARKIMRLYKEGILLSNLLPEEVSIICDVVKNHENSFKKMIELFPNDYIRSSIGKGIVVGDNLIEASGPRGLERRSFFVGKERMKNGDITMFNYPDESYLAVLGETLIRLYDLNRADNYPKELRIIVDFLHSTQYEFLAGLLYKAGMSEVEAGKFMKKKGFPRIEKVVNRIMDEKHLDGKYFKSSEFPHIANVIETIREDKSLGESAYKLVMDFATAETPWDVVNFYESNTIEGPPAYKRWVDGIISYRSGEFRKVLKEVLS